MILFTEFDWEVLTVPETTVWFCCCWLSNIFGKSNCFVGVVIVEETAFTMLLFKSVVTAVAPTALLTVEAAAWSSDELLALLAENGEGVRARDRRSLTAAIKNKNIISFFELLLGF